MWRATVRISLNKDTGSKIRNEIAPFLKNSGFQNTKTGTWEAFSSQSSGLTSGIKQMLEAVEKSGKMDHIWIHIEQLSGLQKTRLSKAMSNFLKEM